MPFTSHHGRVRGGLADARNLGAMTPLDRSEFSLPDICKNLRNARNELHVSATVEVDT
jgi:hypothetical protein